MGSYAVRLPSSRRWQSVTQVVSPVREERTVTMRGRPPFERVAVARHTGLPVVEYYEIASAVLPLTVANS